jgi:hypothetical protein
LDGKPGEYFWQPGEGVAIGEYIPGATGAVPLPVHFTIDLKRKAVFSRFNYLGYNRTPYWLYTLPMDFEIWASNECIPAIIPGNRTANLANWTDWEIVNGTAEWEKHWTKIATCQIRSVTGASKYSAGMQLSTDDIMRYTTLGWDFDMDNNVDAFRYIRFKISNFSDTNRKLFVAELSFWGQWAE